MTHNNTIASLDGLRAISILLVIVSHGGFGHVVPGGLGVTIFFFLSGYLITTLLLSEHVNTGTINIAHFYARRAFRLMPPLIVTLIAAYWLTLSGLLGGGVSIEGFFAQLFYLANYYMIYFDTNNTTPFGTASLWSLAVEEHFYIIYPLFLLLLMKQLKTLSRIAVVLVTLCVVVLIWRYHLATQLGVNSIRIDFGSDTRADSLLFGCLLSITCNPLNHLRENEAMQHKHWALLAAAGMLLLATLLIRNPLFRDTLRYTLQGISLAPIFYLAIRFSHCWVFRLLNTRPMIALGVWSYAIYLIHGIVIGLADNFTPGLLARPFLFTPTLISVSCIFAIFIDRLIDPYFRELRSRLRPQAQVRVDRPNSDDREAPPGAPIAAER